MKIHDAKTAEKNILGISQTLNLAIREAIQSGLVVDADVQVSSACGRKIPRIEVEVKIHPSDVDIN